MVTWYNERRGYGFVRFDKDEIFLHHSALTRFGLETVYPGDQLSVYLAENECGPVIREILAVERAKPLSVSTDTEIQAHEVKGIVKFFNAYKGCGLSILARMKEMFLSISARFVIVVSTI